ncbi:hypothetical protein ASF17_13500 [Frigoribacterium sp. Leaf263]|uniref:M60 family metallopeptidase n=1 Tax=Frigoribacterium sp. Leaf263 TaxID=1736313 RepID=UPI000701E39E|nr:M60 family metallopeptidase [Frigoribacterium sp. Leaf263]KQO81126.1 hypothetical protein ASF17_13500 [Frigoribacterium sp. Leaf263]
MPRLPRTALALALTLSLAAPLGASTGARAAAAPSSTPASTTPASTSSPDRSSAPASLPGGPRPTSIRVADDDSSTSVLVHGLGSASAAQARENRSMRHSDLQPTGRFAAAGDELTITVPEGAPAVSVTIGLIGVHEKFNGGVERGQWSQTLAPGPTLITSPLDGMVHLVSTDEGGSADVVVEGGRPVPVFVAGQTTNTGLRAEMARLADAPFVQVIGDRFFGDFQTHFTGTVIVQVDMEDRVADLDRMIEITNDTYGLRDDGTGLSRKAPHRIYVAAPDTSGGYANATHGRVTFPVRSGAAGDLFRMASHDLWGWWHEVGHTYQTPTFNWGGQGEVLVNLSPLHIQSASGWGNRLDRFVGGYDAFFAQPIEQRDYMATGDVWTRLFLYDQLRRAFGDDFYAHLNQEYRVMRALGESQPVGAEAQRQLFAVTASRVADRDLTEYFQQWGMALDEATRAVLADLPPLQQPIWENRLSSEPVVEHEMPSFSVPVGALDPIAESVTLGRRGLDAPPTARDLRDSDDARSVRTVATGLDATRMGNGSARLVAVNEVGVREVLSTPVTVTRGTSLEFRGLSDRVVTTLALQPATDELRMIAGTEYTSHPGFGSEYIGATVSDGRGRPRESFSVTGGENAHAAARVFDGTTIREGWHLTVRHREAASRLSRWDSEEPASRNGSTTQHLRVVDGRLVAVDAVPTPPDGPLLPVAPDGTPLLTRGAPTALPVTVEATSDVRALDTELVLTAPSGTTFSTGQEALVTEVRLPGRQWVVSRSVVAAEGVLSDDGRTLTLVVRGADGLDLPDGSRLRWMPEVVVPRDGGPVGGGLDWSLTGTTGDAGGAADR